MPSGSLQVGRSNAPCHPTTVVEKMGKCYERGSTFGMNVSEWRGGLLSHDLPNINRCVVGMPIILVTTPGIVSGISRTGVCSFCLDILSVVGCNI